MSCRMTIDWVMRLLGGADYFSGAPLDVGVGFSSLIDRQDAYPTWIDCD